MLRSYLDFLNSNSDAKAVGCKHITNTAFKKWKPVPCPRDEVA